MDIFKYSNCHMSISTLLTASNYEKIRTGSCTFFSKNLQKKKKIGHLVGNWKKSGPRSQNYVSKISRFRVTDHKPKSKKWPKSQITRQKKFLESSRWYQKMRRRILHHPCEFQKNPLVCSRMLRVTELGRVFQYVAV